MIRNRCEGETKEFGGARRTATDVSMRTAVVESAQTIGRWDPGIWLKWSCVLEIDR